MFDCQIECPYCGGDFYPDLDIDFHDSETVVDCDSCEKQIVLKLSISIDIDNIEKAPCLNGEEGHRTFQMRKDGSKFCPDCQEFIQD